MDTNQALNETSTKIATLNDEFRSGMSGCTVTRGVAALVLFMNDIFVKVRGFSEFNEDNNPYGDHTGNPSSLRSFGIFLRRARN